MIKGVHTMFYSSQPEALRAFLGGVFCSVVIGSAVAGSLAQPLHHSQGSSETSSPARVAGALTTAAGVSGQGDLRFRVLYTRSHLPEAAVAVLESAHGGFTVDRRPGRGETYFFLPGAGIVVISGDLKSTRLLDTDDRMKGENLHNTMIWFDPDGTPFLTFPANNAGLIFTTTLQGKLVHTLEIPGGRDSFDQPTVDDYFLGRGKFAPTDVAHLQGLFYITTGYSSLDYVLTAKILSTHPVFEWSGTIWLLGAEEMARGSSAPAMESRFHRIRNESMWPTGRSRKSIALRVTATIVQPGGYRWAPGHATSTTLETWPW